MIKNPKDILKKLINSIDDKELNFLDIAFDKGDYDTNIKEYRKELENAWTDLFKLSYAIYSLNDPYDSIENYDLNYKTGSDLCKGHDVLTVCSRKCFTDSIKKLILSEETEVKEILYLMIGVHELAWEEYLKCIGIEREKREYKIKNTTKKRNFIY